MTNRSLKRFEGRLYVDQGKLYFILEALPEAGTARVSCRVDGKTEVSTVPLADIVAILAANPELQLDALGSKESSKRVKKRANGWFFHSREGEQGPYMSADEAEEALQQHILSSQSTAEGHQAA